jgi:ubiquinone/menaquinone biosynthesis C-methylase UbiE
VFSVVGIDPSIEMLRVARTTSVMPGRHRRTVRFVEGTAEALPRPDRSATVLWSLATVHHWRDLDAGLAEARRVLRPSGRFLAIERRTTADATGIASHGWTADQAHELAARCEACGFRDLVVTEHDIGPRGVHAVLATAP